ncbi:hypothetical protein ACJX0J_026308, partial [Zea mays]
KNKGHQLCGIKTHFESCFEPTCEQEKLTAGIHFFLIARYAVGLDFLENFFAVISNNKFWE